MIKRICMGILFLFYAVNAAIGQSELDIPIKKSVNQSTLFGIGTMYLTDTYLSPLEYNGISLSLMHERLNATSLFNDKLLLQQQYFLQTSSTENPIGNTKTYYGNLDYKINGFYPLLKNQSFRLLGGAGADLSLGGIYNIRNSNNPAQLKASTNINLSVLAFYNWKMLTFRWQITSPLLGVFFSPEYGHSYYEIFVLGNNKGTIHLGSPANQRGLRNYITADYPIGNLTLRAGYLGNYYHTDVNNLITSISSHQFMIGLTFESLSFGSKEARKNEWLKSVYYE
ncbi:MAG: DUF3316 domain-containing protein [Dysgonamonadaceae bacterium]|nr:DUF3316 domain-containing protein [Dysgonamonadaceae bacterium]MDD3355554.1 DUF3316 domain-containing protein [Dysgonamonadaceae bacterium]MDD3726947.1 DUF3316 domain-containing protein [Dysgonamonadaceae bacterium]MDD4245792.1 DUF3316 domain-containing protein [Dysgonamonadaceae bacterium]MDD4605171.1 DUF3316 domain-containing protein [Dysgonamonadaceae bacterium]